MSERLIFRGARILESRVTLTHDEILALPTTPIEIIPPPLLAKNVFPLYGFVRAFGPGGVDGWGATPYTNVPDPDETSLLLSGPGLFMLSGDDLADFFAGNLTSLCASGPAGGGLAPDSEPTVLQFDGGPFTDLEDGHEENRLLVVVQYMIRSRGDL